MEYQHEEAIAFLENLPGKAEWSLGPMRDLCALLEIDPAKLPCMLVTGTNGKGSVCALCESAIRGAGYKTGRYISPHLVDYEERISVGGKDISRQDFARLVLSMRPAVEKYNAGHKETISLFEIITAVAFRHFLDSKVDFAVLEIGLGGRLDSTNVASPSVCVITNVSLEHTAKLGNTARKIAAEKSGVMREGKPVVTACEGEALEEVRAQAQKTGANLVSVGTAGSDINYAKKSSTLEGTTAKIAGKYGEAELSTALLGWHQCQNMAVAYAALEELDKGGALEIPKEAIAKGFAAAKWPGRLEIVGRSPLVIFDGAHNPHGAAALATAVKELLKGREIVAVCAMMKDKDIDSSLSQVLPLAKRTYATAVQVERSESAEGIARRAAKYCAQVEVEPDCSKALQKATVEAAKSGAVVLVFGSLYLVGELRQKTGWQKD